MEERRIKETAKFTYRMINKMVDVPFAEFFQFSQANTRQGGIRFIHSRHNINTRKYFFKPRAERLWSELSKDTISAPSFGRFKKALDRDEAISRNLKGSRLK